MGNVAKVMDRRTVLSPRADRRGREDVIVQYQATGVGVWSITIPAEDATPEGIAAAIKADVASRRQLTQTEIPLD
jgi:hypothetical protein